MKNRLRFLTVLDIIKNNSNQANHLTASEIMEFLEEKNYKVDSKTILSDINDLIEYGYKIKKVYDGVYYDGQLFSLAELKILNDGIRSSSFLNKDKADEIVEKLMSFTNSSGRKMIENNSYNNNISMNTMLMHNIENIIIAINNRQAITFDYFDYDTNFKKNYRKHNYLIYPYSLINKDNRYYLVGSSLKYGGYSNYRVDKIDNVNFKKKYFDSIPSDINNYLDKIFKMYNSEIKNITLKVRSYLLDELYQQFSKQMIITEKGKDYFVCNISVSISKSFFGWLFMMGKDIEILKPQEVKEDYIKMCESIIHQYL